MSNLIFEGIEDEWRVYRNGDGFMEGYKTIGEKKDIKRIVTNQTTLAGFGKYIRGLRRRTPVKDKPLKPGDLPKLFDA